MPQQSHAGPATAGRQLGLYRLVHPDACVRGRCSGALCEVGTMAVGIDGVLLFATVIGVPRQVLRFRFPPKIGESPIRIA